MSNANQCTVYITLNSPNTFNNGFLGDLVLDITNGYNKNFSTIAGNAVVAVFTGFSLAPGPHKLYFLVPSSAINFLEEPITLTAEFIFANSNTQVVKADVEIPMKLSSNGEIYETQEPYTNFAISCLHGDSLVETKTGVKKIKNLTNDDEILTGDNIFAPVVSLVQCWLQILDSPDSHDAIIFEKDSLGLNEPSERLVIDPGHPICTRAEYEKNGTKALRKAGEYITTSNNGIYVKKWTDPIIKSDDSKKVLRYDIVLPSPHKTYLANNIVIKARKSVIDAGYQHAYKNFV